MSEWLVTALAGVLSGVAMFFCVRFRMHFGPRVLGRFGAWPRRALWAATILVMIALLNIALLLLRNWLHGRVDPTVGVYHELVFAALAALTGLALVFRRSWPGR